MKVFFCIKADYLLNNLFHQKKKNKFGIKFFATIHNGSCTIKSQHVDIEKYRKILYLLYRILRKNIHCIWIIGIWISRCSTVCIWIVQMCVLRKRRLRKKWEKIKKKEMTFPFIWQLISVICYAYGGVTHITERKK